MSQSASTSVDAINPVLPSTVTVLLFSLSKGSGSSGKSMCDTDSHLIIGLLSSSINDSYR